MKHIFFLSIFLVLQFCGKPSGNPNLMLSAVEARYALGGSGLLIDMRPRQEFTGRHICGAVHIEDFRATDPDPQRYVVIYGSGNGGGSESRAFARALRELGYAKTFVVEGGYPALLKAKYELSAANHAAAAVNF